MVSLLGHVISSVEVRLDRLQALLVVDPLPAGVLLDLPGLVDAGDDGLPGLLQGLDLDRAARGQAGGHLGLLGGVLRVPDQHLVGLGVQGGHGLGLDALPLEHDGLGQPA